MMKFKKICNGEYKSVSNRYKIERNDYCSPVQWDIYTLTKTGYEWDMRLNTKKKCIEWIEQDSLFDMPVPLN